MPSELELYGIYVLREVYGTGTGERLLEAAIGHHGAASLWVLESNERAPGAPPLIRKAGVAWDSKTTRSTTGSRSPARCS
jgi:GNAT superfamily N-acetyltransferase